MVLQHVRWWAVSTVWKYDVPVDDQVHVVDMPPGFVIGVACQRPNCVTFWAEVDSDAPVASRSFVVIGTGHIVPDESIHLGIAFDGPFVWHLYEVDLEGRR